MHQQQLVRKLYQVSWICLSAATLGKIRLDLFPLFRFEDLYGYGIAFFGVDMSVEFADSRRQFDVMTLIEAASWMILSYI